MTLNIPAGIPATSTLLKENIVITKDYNDKTLNNNSLVIAVLNLMPAKIITETQILRLLCHSKYEITVIFLHAKTHISKNTSIDHLSKFYKTFDDIKNDKIDGLIITGAPVESFKFENVDYWEELTKIMKWSKTHVNSTMHICWAAQAALYYRYGIQKYPLKEKLTGIFKHDIINKNDNLLKDFEDNFLAPHSRHTKTRKRDIINSDKLEILSESSEAGLYIIKEINGNNIYVTGHSEYDSLTLKNEYERDIIKNSHSSIPKNYFPNDDPSRAPLTTWTKHANLLFTNWITYYVKN